MSAIELVPVESSNVAGVGHDPAADELHVRFKSGPTVYVYSNVTAEKHQALMSADSIGGHGHGNIWCRHLEVDGTHPHPVRKLPQVFPS
jgi:KTSC domain